MQSEQCLSAQKFCRNLIRAIALNITQKILYKIIKLETTLIHIMNSHTNVHYSEIHFWHTKKENINESLYRDSTVQRYQAEKLLCLENSWAAKKWSNVSSIPTFRLLLPTLMGTQWLYGKRIHVWTMELVPASESLKSGFRLLTSEERQSSRAS